MPLGFKVVRKKRLTKGYWSYLPSDEVQYQIGKRTFPRRGYGPLTCFSTLETAIDFALRESYGFIQQKIFSSKYHIFEVEYAPSSERRVYAPSYPNDGEPGLDLKFLPKGTVLAKWVHLRREVSKDEKIECILTSIHVRSRISATR